MLGRHRRRPRPARGHHRVAVDRRCDPGLARRAAPLLSGDDRPHERSVALPRLGLIALTAVVAATLGVEATSTPPATAELRRGLRGLRRASGRPTEHRAARQGRRLRQPDPARRRRVARRLDALPADPARGRPAALRPRPRTTERRLAELRARDIVRRHGAGTLDYFALRDDKQFFFFRDSLVAYAVYGGVALVSPDPIGPEAERAEAFSAFRAFAEARGWTIGVMGAGEEWLPIYDAAGTALPLPGRRGDRRLPAFSLAGGKMKGLRQACTRLARHGYTVEFLDPGRIDPSRVTGIVELISMLRRGDDERGFSMMLGRLFDPKDRGLLLTVVYGPDGEPGRGLPVRARRRRLNGYSLDLMRRDPGEHPNGLLDYALCSTIEHLRQQGGGGLSLNFAAFRSVLEGERGEGTFTRVERWALKRLSGILPIESLWSFNAKYRPDVAAPLPRLPRRRELRARRRGDASRREHHRDCRSSGASSRTTPRTGPARSCPKRCSRPRARSTKRPHAASRTP